MNDFENTLGTALRERVDGETPDLQRLVDGSVHAGLRLRRRRRVGAIVAGVAGVAGIAVASSLLAGGGPARSDDAGLATEPSATASPTPSPPARPADLGPLEDYLMDLNVSYGASYSRRSIELPIEVTPDQRVEVSALTPQGWEVEYVDFNAPPVGLVTEVPVNPPKGWECEWFLVDDKAACTAEDGGVAGLVIRAASEHAEWTSSSDKGGPGSGAFVTDVHDGIFISVQGGQGTTDAELKALRDGLTWVR